MGKSRPRFNTKSGSAYMPQEYTINVSEVQWKLRTATMRAPGFLSPTAQYRVLVVAFRKRRQAKAPGQILRRDQECPLGCFAIGKPDLDNLIGTIMDAATSLLYADDRQVVDERAIRLWADQDGAQLRVEKLTP